MTIALRNLRKQQAYTFINIIGLTLGITSAMLLLLYVVDELSYDRYHEKAERIYRVAMDVHMGDEERKVAVAPAALAPTLTKNYTDIEQYALIRPINDFKIIKAGETFPQPDVFYASATVFDVFSYQLVEGNAETALQKPNSIVINQRIANQYFPGQEAVGKTMQGENETLYQITGVMADVTENGHFTPQALVSIWDQEKLSSWGDWNWSSYVLVSPGFEPETFQDELQQVSQNHLAERLAEMNGSIAFVMQPLTDIHFYSRRDFEMRVNDGNMHYIYTFSCIAFLLLLIACINYMNLATARSIKRAKEVGIRKALGSLRGQLIRQFLMESYFMIGLAVSLSVLLIGLLLPLFNRFTEKAIRLSSLAEPANLLWAVVFVILLGILAGGYPAFFLSRFSPVKVLKGNHMASPTSGFSFRQVLVVFQFIISSMMLVCTLVVYQQLRFLNKQYLGFDPQQIITVHLSSEAREHFLPLKEALLKNGNIQQVATTKYIPGEKPEINSFHVESTTGKQDQIFQQIWVDHDFAPTLGIQLMHGRNFASREPEDTTKAGVLVNEALVKAMGWTTESAIGKKLSSEEWEDEVIGVVKNFHMISLHDVIEPIVIRYWTPANQILIRVNHQNIQQTLAYITQTWNEVVGKTALNYTFLDQHFQQQYEKDEKRGVLFADFSGLTIFIACLGLLGLVSYSATQRTKEIGIRKVMGASVGNILLLLSKEYIKLVAVALVIAIPIANYFITEWLSHFAYKTEIQWWYFLLPGLAMLLIALLTVSQRTVKAAVRNPADSLRYE